VTQGQSLALEDQTARSASLVTALRKMSLGCAPSETGMGLLFFKKGREFRAFTPYATCDPAWWSSVWRRVHDTKISKAWGNRGWGGGLPDDARGPGQRASGGAFGDQRGRQSL
jgi:hypothetical protein